MPLERTTRRAFLQEGRRRLPGICSGTRTQSAIVVLPMARNPDPKPGRWILPLIIVGMVGFTYLFTNSIDTPAEVPDNEASGSSSTTSTTEQGTSAQTTTTRPSVVSDEVRAYTDGLDIFSVSMADLETRMAAANTAWDDRSANYADTKTALDTLIADTTAFGDQVAAATPPAGEAELAVEHGDIVSAAAAAKTAAENVYDGLVNSEGSEARLAALAAFNQAVQDFNSAVSAAKVVAGTS